MISNCFCTRNKTEFGGFLTCMNHLLEKLLLNTGTFILLPKDIFIWHVALKTWRKGICWKQFDCCQILTSNMSVDKPITTWVQINGDFPPPIQLFLEQSLLVFNTPLKLIWMESIEIFIKQKLEKYWKHPF